MFDNSSSKIKGAPSASESVNKAMGLPKTYGDTKIAVLPRDPLWIYAYWEVSSDAAAALRKKLGEEKFNASRWMLRVYDVTGVQFNGSNAHRYFDISINHDIDNWYINVGETNRAWCIDLGLLTPDGEFVIIARSNILAMPRQGVSPLPTSSGPCCSRNSNAS